MTKQIYKKKSTIQIDKEKATIKDQQILINKLKKEIELLKKNQNRANQNDIIS